VGGLAAQPVTGLSRLRLPGDRGESYRVLALGAHPDDIEIGCAATLMRLVDDGSIAALRWVVLTGTAERASEARDSAAALAGDTLLEASVEAFPDGFLPWSGGDVKAFFETLKSFRPDVVFTHRIEDAHQDHRMVAELTWQTFREAVICEYEIPKYEGDLGHPNLYVSVSEELAQRKVQHLHNQFPSQRGRRWFTDDTFWALARLRGIESNASTGLAEAFTCRKVVL
jgi:LmbE family N-acetylglucosaminyl deacetylase